MGDLVRKLGVESLKDFKDRFDEICDKYQIKAKEQGYNGNLLFKKERGKMVIFVSLDED